MGRFRIALGSASCRTYAGNDPNIREVCKLLIERLSFLQGLQYSHLQRWAESESEIHDINGKNITLNSYIQNNEDGSVLVVVQAFYPTFKYPNYLSRSFVGKVFAEGSVIDKEGNIHSAMDEDLWSYR